MMSSCGKEKIPLLSAVSRSEEYIQMNETPCSNSLPTATSDVRAAHNERLVSLDQYRGFVILCSLIVPLVGRLDAAPAVFSHNNNFFSIAGLCNYYYDSVSRIIIPYARWCATLYKKHFLRNVNLFRNPFENA